MKTVLHPGAPYRCLPGDTSVAISPRINPKEIEMELVKRYAAVTVLSFLCINFATMGCATLGTVCDKGPEIKARIRSALQIAQVGYPLVASLAGQQVNTDLLAKVGIIDAALDLLGQLAFDIACPTLAELNKAQSALEAAQEAKAGLGVK